MLSTFHLFPTKTPCYITLLVTSYPQKRFATFHLFPTKTPCYLLFTSSPPKHLAIYFSPLHHQNTNESFKHLAARPQRISDERQFSFHPQNMRLRRHDCKPEKKNKKQTEYASFLQRVSVHVRPDNADNSPHSESRCDQCRPIRSVVKGFPFFFPCLCGLSKTTLCLRNSRSILPLCLSFLQSRKLSKWASP